MVKETLYVEVILNYWEDWQIEIKHYGHLRGHLDFLKEFESC